MLPWNNGDSELTARGGTGPLPTDADQCLHSGPPLHLVTLFALIQHVGIFGKHLPVSPVDDHGVRDPRGLFARIEALCGGKGALEKALGFSRGRTPGRRDLLMQTGMEDQEPPLHTAVALKFWCLNPSSHVTRIFCPGWYHSTALGVNLPLGISGVGQAPLANRGGDFFLA